MLFFQSALVLGYAYSHFITQRLTARHQWILHTVLLLIAILTLPIRPTDYWKPDSGEMPTFRILLLLAASVGLPFILLSTTGPLIQAWQTQTHPDRSPFRLFALSNFASLLALISYPFVFESNLALDEQSWFWSIGFGVFALCALCSGQLLVKSLGEASNERLFQKDVSGHTVEKVGGLKIALWLILPMLASVQLLATTNLMTQEVGSLPFLWIVPLSLYLLSFIICFDHERWYIRSVFFPFFFVAAILSCLVLEIGISVPIFFQVLGYAAVCFGAAMCCHGELARSKPGPERLTMFYLLISIGGALGGVFVAIVAPRIFVGFYEFQFSLIAAIGFTLLAYAMQTRKMSKEEGGVGVGALCLFAGILVFGLAVAIFEGFSAKKQIADDSVDAILLKTRNEYGTLTVSDYEDVRKLYHGSIEHGYQFKDSPWRGLPSSYYGPLSGVGVAMTYLRHTAEADWEEGGRDDKGIDIGVIGLGVGTICGWAEPDDTLRYFEINPDVVELANRDFWYIKDCVVEPEVKLGDARLLLEKEVDNDDPRRYDILIADAFSSDSIPMHLLTLESMDIYLKRLKPNGILAVHVSNRFLYLENVVRLLAKELGCEAILLDQEPQDGEDFYNSSSWVLVTRDQKFVDAVQFEFGDDQEPTLSVDYWPEERYTARWTDDFSSIVPVIYWDNDGFEWFTEKLVDLGWISEEEDGEDESEFDEIDFMFDETPVEDDKDEDEYEDE